MPSAPERPPAPPPSAPETPPAPPPSAPEAPPAPPPNAVMRAFRGDSAGGGSGAAGASSMPPSPGAVMCAAGVGAADEGCDVGAGGAGGGRCPAKAPELPAAPLLPSRAMPLLPPPHSTPSARSFPLPPSLTPPSASPPSSLPPPPPPPPPPPSTRAATSTAPPPVRCQLSTAHAPP
eukprot:351219-Chlamydomonas_euryale.AAC.14